MKPLKRIAKTAGYTAGIIILVILMLAGLSQTQWFRDRLSSIIISKLSSQLNGTLYFGSLKGNLVTGFTIDSLAVFQDSQEMMTANQLTLHYDPLTFLEHKLVISQLILEQPTIHIKRTARNTWNIDNFLKSSESPSGSSFTGTIDIHDLDIRHGTVILKDSTMLSSANGTPRDTVHINFHNFTVHDLNLKCNVVISSDRYQTHVAQASLYVDTPQFELNHFKGDFIVDAKHTAAKNVIIQTKHSYLELDASLKHSVIAPEFTLQNLERDSTSLYLKSTNLDFTELKRFLPPLDFLDGSASLECDAEGLFGNLNIKRLNIQTFKSSLHLAGNIRNLHQPHDLFLSVVLGESKIVPNDLQKLLPLFNIPSFDEVGPASLFVEYTGSPLNFKSKLLLSGSFGSIQANGNLNLLRSDPAYNVSYTTRGLQLGSLLSSKNIHTSLFTSGELHGEGFSYDRMHAQGSIAIDTSQLQHLPLIAAKIEFKALPNRIEGTAHIVAQEMSADLQGDLDFSAAQRPKFSCDATLRSFNFAKIFSDPKYESDLSLHTTVNGSGRTIDDISGNAVVSLLQSSYQQRDIAPQDIHVSLDQSDITSKHLTFKSSFADIQCDGRFDLDLATAAIVNRANDIIHAVQTHAMPPESVAAPQRPMHIALHSPEQREMHFTYAVQIKDFDPIHALLGETQFDARGSLQGSVSGTDERLSVSASGSLDELFVGSVNKGVLLNNTSVAVSLEQATPDQTLENLKGSLDLNIGSGIFNRTPFEPMHLKISYDSFKGKFALTTLVDSLYDIKLIGEASIQPHTYAIDVDSMAVTVGEYSWINDQDIQMRLNYDGLRFMHAVMKRHDENISLTGALHLNSQLDVNATLHHINLAGMNYLLRDPDLLMPGHGFQGDCDADLQLSGYTSAPVLGIHASSDSTFFQQTFIGILQADIRYENQRTAIDVNLKKSDRDPLPSLSIKGMVPLNLAPGSPGELFPDSLQRLHITSQGFDLSVLDPVLRDFDRLNGKVRCNIDVGGTPLHPEYTGTLSLDSVRFIFGPNNLPYTVNGTFEPDGNKILVKEMHIANPSATLYKTDAQVDGSITIKDFRVDSYDLAIKGKILLMSDATRTKISAFYGTLYTETDADGLNLKGTLAVPRLTGKLFILNQNLTFPPTNYAELQNANQVLTYVLVDDTTHIVASEHPLARKFYGPTDSAVVRHLRPMDISFVDRLRYDLTIETRGITAMKMIFTPSTNEELYAELEGTLHAVNDNGTPTLFGEISVTPRSYYNFFKRFDASGKLKFVGQWDNPELDIRATYEGYTQTTVSGTSNDPSPTKIEEKVIVELKISGTRYEPKLDIGLKVQPDPNQEPIDRSTQARGGDVQSDAISFIITGKFRDELSSNDRQNIAADFGSASVSGFTTSLFSGVLTDFFHEEIPFIRTAELTYGGGNIQESADLRISGEAFNGYFRFGGRILNDINNANVSYQLSVGKILNLQNIRNLFIEVERKVEGSDLTEDKKLSNNARLYYRISF